MGHNDHLLVPDPKKRSDAIQAYHAKGPLGGPTTSGERLDALEEEQGKWGVRLVALNLNIQEAVTAITELRRSRERHDAQAVALQNHFVETSLAILELTRLLKQTIRGVERLAQGHSKGNLGLPTAEDWAASKP